MQNALLKLLTFFSQFRAVLHQLLQRKAAAAVHRAHAEDRAGRVSRGGHSVDAHRVL